MNFFPFNPWSISVANNRVMDLSLQKKFIRKSWIALYAQLGIVYRCWILNRITELSSTVKRNFPLPGLGTSWDAEAHRAVGWEFSMPSLISLLVISWRNSLSSAELFQSFTFTRDTSADNSYVSAGIFPVISSKTKFVKHRHVRKQ